MLQPKQTTSLSWLWMSNKQFFSSGTSVVWWMVEWCVHDQNPITNVTLLWIHPLSITERGVFETNSPERKGCFCSVGSNTASLAAWTNSKLSVDFFSISKGCYQQGKSTMPLAATGWIYNQSGTLNVIYNQLQPWNVWHSTVRHMGGGAVCGSIFSWRKMAVWSQMFLNYNETAH